MKNFILSICLISTKLSNIMDAHKHGNKEKLSINSLSLFICNLKEACKNSRLHCIDKTPTTVLNHPKGQLRNKTSHLSERTIKD